MPPRNATLATAAFLTTSIAMVICNKAIAFYGDISGIQLVLILFQNAIAAVLLLGTVCLPATAAQWQDIPSLFARRDTLTLTVFFATMLVSSLVSLQHLSIATVVLMKNFSTVLTVAGEKYAFGRPVPPATTVALTTMIAASVAYTRFDLGFSAVGYIFCAINALSTTAYTLLMQAMTTHDLQTLQDLDHLFAEEKPGDDEAAVQRVSAAARARIAPPKELIVLALNVLSLPMITAAALLCNGNQFANLADRPVDKTRAEFVFANVGAASFAAGIGYATVWLVEVSAAAPPARHRRPS
eukprot:3504502-Rhodomonas_salina.2